MSNYRAAHIDSGNGYNYKVKLAQHNLLFYEIPKSASSSIKNWLFSLRQGEGETSSFPMGYEKWQTLFPDMKADYNDTRDASLTKFIFLRNPFARLLSGYNNTGWKFEFEGVAFDDFCLSLRQRIDTPPTDLMNNHFKPVDYFVPKYNRSLCVDFVGKVENLGEDICRLATIAGAPSPISIPHINKTGLGTSYRKFYNCETRQIIEEIYRDELEMGSYVF